MSICFCVCILFGFVIFLIYLYILSICLPAGITNFAARHHLFDLFFVDILLVVVSWLMSYGINMWFKLVYILFIYSLFLFTLYFICLQCIYILFVYSNGFSTCLVSVALIVVSSPYEAILPIIMLFVFVVCRFEL